MTSTNTSISPNKISHFSSNHADSIHLPSYTHVLQNLFQIIQKRRVQTMRKLTKTAAVVASMAVMAMGTAVMTSAAQEGWVQRGSDWYFYVNGNAVENQWVLAGEKWYFLGDDGKMVKDAFIEDNEEYEDKIEDLEGGDTDSPVYYVGADGAMVTGWKSIDKNGGSKPKSDNEWYYFGGTGMMFGKQWVQAGEKWYYLGSNGIMLKNDYDEDDGDYYLGKDGVMISGWYKLTDKDSDLGEEDEWVYADDDEIIKDEWKKIDGKWYYFGKPTKKSNIVSGTAVLLDDNQKSSAMNEEAAIMIQEGKSKKWYYLKKNGAMETGWFSIKAKDDNDKNITYKYYAGSNGEIKCNGEISGVSGKNYYFYDEHIDIVDKDGKIDEKIYVGQYLDDKYVVEYEKDKTKVVLKDDNGKVHQCDSRSAAQTYAKDNLPSDVTSYKIYRLGTSTTYKETRKGN